MNTEATIPLLGGPHDGDCAMRPDLGIDPEAGQAWWFKPIGRTPGWAHAYRMEADGRLYYNGPIRFVGNVEAIR